MTSGSGPWGSGYSAGGGYSGWGAQPQQQPWGAQQQQSWPTAPAPVYPPPPSDTTAAADWPIWPIASLVTGIFAAVLALLPDRVGMVGIFAGAAGIGAAMVALLQPNRRMVAFTVSGIVVSLLSVSLAITLIFVRFKPAPPPAQSPASAPPKSMDHQTEDIIKNRLEVKWGSVDCESSGGQCRPHGVSIPVTYTNRLDHVAHYIVLIGLLDGEFHQVASGVGVMTLSPHATERKNTILFGSSDLAVLKAADVRVLGAAESDA